MALPEAALCQHGQILGSFLQCFAEDYKITASVISLWNERQTIAKTTFSLYTTRGHDVPNTYFYVFNCVAGVGRVCDGKIEDEHLQLAGKWVGDLMLLCTIQ